MITVIEVNKPTAVVKGYLQRYMLEVRAGLFVGSLPKMVRESIWGQIRRYMSAGSAIMIAPAQTEAGYEIFTLGKDRRVPVDNCGVWLVEYTKHYEIKDP